MINGCVFRIGGKFYLLSFISETRHEIKDDFYLTCENGKSLPDHSIMLVHYTEEKNENVSMFQTKPITCFMLTYEGKSVPVKGYNNDAIIIACYQAATQYLKIKASS